jgi:hypothetical protein
MGLDCEEIHQVLALLFSGCFPCLQPVIVFTFICIIHRPLSFCVHLHLRIRETHTNEIRQDGTDRVLALK